MSSNEYINPSANQPSAGSFLPSTQDASIADLVSTVAGRSPDAVALGEGRQVLTYRTLDNRSNQLAHYLRSCGVSGDTIVALCLPRSSAFVVAALAVLKAGGAYLPLDPAYPAERLNFILRDAQVTVLLTDCATAKGLSKGGCRVVALDAEEMRITSQPTNRPLPTPKPHNLAYVVYTSGSTGQPKGVLITHDNLLNLVTWHQRTFAVTASDRASQLASPAFDAAVWEIWPYLSSGASVHIPDENIRVSPQLLMNWIIAVGITISFVPTPLAERLITLNWPADVRLRLLLTGGDVLHRYPSPILPFLVVNNYGPTECTVVATSGIVPTRASEVPPTIGRPIDNVVVYILNERLERVASGEPGELFIAGAGVGLEYLNRPELTAERFIPNPFGTSSDRLYRTGDVARYLPDGQIAFLGRIDEQVKIRGHRVEPNEVAVALNKHPKVEISVVVASETDDEPRLIAYFVASPQSFPSPASLRDFLRQQIPDYMIPSVFVALPSMPLTSNGKLDRDALPPPSPDTILKDEVYTPPRTSIEQRTAGIVASLLRLDEIDVNDNFFLMGGHSLLATQVVSQVNETFNVELTLLQLFEHPTVAELCAEIEQMMSTSEPREESRTSQGG